MKLKLWVAALVGLILAGCTQVPCTPTSGEREPMPMLPQVQVVASDYLVVDQEPLVFTQDKIKVRIHWQLPRAGRERFPDHGIVLEPGARDEIVDCRPSSDRLEFSCLNLHSKPGKYKYTINVEQTSRLVSSERGSRPHLLVLDPTILNL